MEFLDFSFSKLEENLFLVKKQYFNKKSGSGSDITGPYWMLIEVTVLKKAFTWFSDGKAVGHTDSSIYLFVPPYSWCKEHYPSGSELKIRGLISKDSLNFKSFENPTLFSCSAPFPKRLAEVPSFLEGAHTQVSVPLCSQPTPLTLRVKNLIDKNIDFDIQKIAGKLKTSSAVISRAFKKDFGYSPAHYRRGLRITIAMYELMMGTPPAEAAGLAGYNDLSRFYKQFKQYMLQTPAKYLKKSKNAKKSH